MKKGNVNEELTQHSNGTDDYHRISTLFRNHVATDGVKHLADMCQSYWLLDAILSHQITPKVKKELFQVWKLQQQKNDAYLLTCEDGNNNVITSQKIPFSDFPYQQATIWLCDNVLLLPCEY